MVSVLNWRIALADVRLTDEQLAAAHEVLASGWLSMGPRTAAFEERFATESGLLHCICVSSATGGLVVALQALGVGPGAEVIVPSLTFVADANAVRVLGAVPVFADVESDLRPLVDPADVRQLVSPRTRAVITVDYAGVAADIKALDELRAAGIGIVEDASHAVGPARDDGAWLDFAGDAVVFSFFANKNLAVGEGGMFATNDPALAERVRLLRSHGMTSGTWDRHLGHAMDYDVVVPGWNFRPQEVACALGERGMNVLADANRVRRELLCRYRAGFERDGRVVVPFRGDDTTGHLAVVVLPADTRLGVRAALHAAAIQSSVHYPPIHRFSAYAGASARDLPVTDSIAGRLLTLPLHQFLSTDDVDLVVDTVLGALG
jgi:dTDP-4-amino-4,6-dideoxygalactose transaminase